MTSQPLHYHSSPSLGTSLLRVEDLAVHFFLDEGVAKAVDGVSFEIPKGKTLGVVGESGCGKSVTAFSILKLVSTPGRIVGGRILFRRNETEIDLAALDEDGAEIRAIRGKDIAMIFQEPMTSLSPVHPVGSQISEAIRLHVERDKSKARQQAIAMLDRVGIPDAKRRYEQYPHEMSGGLRQRAMIAMALACRPSLLIADEPTTALDVTIQAQIMALMQDLQREFGMSILLITHDLGVVAEMTDDVAVMYRGRIVERASTGQIFERPDHPYTQALLRSIPSLAGERKKRLEIIRGSVPDPFQHVSGCPFHPRCREFVAGLCDQGGYPPLVDDGTGHANACLLRAEGTRSEVRAAREEGELPAQLAPSSPAPSPAPLLEVKNLKMHFPILSGLFRRVAGHIRAVDGVNLNLFPGECMGIVGESGSGKTTVGKCILRILQPSAGSVEFRENGKAVNISQADPQTLRALRKNIQMVFQDPYSSLNPRMTIFDSVGEPLLVNGMKDRRKREEIVRYYLTRVGLKPQHLHRYPHAFSGGQRQRVGIARALVLKPRLIIADEPVSALDVSVQAQVLNLLQDIQTEFGLTYIFIAHDLSVVRHICDRIAVMYLGKIVEYADTDALFKRPLHPYTQALLSAIPIPDPKRKPQRTLLSGEIGDPSNPPPGCPFHPRCAHATDRCRSEVPGLREIYPGHQAACHFAEEF